MLVWGGEVRAQTRADNLNGLWSKDLDTCSLSEDEDETRLIVEDRELRDYSEACRIVNRSVQADRSVLVLLQCPRVSGVRTMRVFPKSAEKAVFYLPENKRPRSRDMIRCPSAPPETPVTTEATEAWTKIRDPRRLIKLWLDARQRCRLPGAPGRQEACAERRQIGSLLRDMKLCHYTKGSREGWQACS